MATTLSDILKRANELLKNTNTSVLSTADRRDLIVRAVREYSVRRPYFGVYAQTAGSNNWYSLPSDFEDGFSSLKAIEYPIQNSPPDYIDDKYYFIDEMADGRMLRFTSNAPSIGEVFWIKYTKRHTFDSSDTSSVPLSDEMGIAYLSCSIFCAAIAGYYAGRAEANLTNIEMPGMESRKDEWSSQADYWWKRYDKEITESTTGVEGYIDFSQDLYFDRNTE